MSELTPNAMHTELRTLIASSRQRLAGMVKIVSTLSTLSTQLNWSHMVAIVALKTPQAREGRQRARVHAGLCGFDVGYAAVGDSDG